MRGERKGSIQREWSYWILDWVATCLFGEWWWWDKTSCEQFVEGESKLLTFAVANWNVNEHRLFLGWVGGSVI